MRSDQRLGAIQYLVVLVALAAVGAGCNSSNPPLNVAPTLSVTAPAADTDIQIGALVAVSYTDNDPDDTATTTLYADADGDLLTLGDQYVIATARPENDGTVQVLNWATAGIPEGSYFVVAVTTDTVNTPVTDTCPGKINVWTLWPRDHSNIPLKDQLGNSIALGSDTPYSPRQTCGACHDVDEIANGYHFQQGRTNDVGTIQTKDDFFNDGRSWLKSDGMYGKW